MKLLVWLEWIAFSASLVLILSVAAFLYTWMPLFTRPCHIDHAEAVANARGDVTENQIRDCAVLGSAAEFRVSLRLAEASDFTPLVYYDSVSNIHLRWLDDDHVSVDLGEVAWLTPKSIISATSRSATLTAAPSPASNRPCPIAVSRQASCAPSGGSCGASQSGLAR